MSGSNSRRRYSRAAWQEIDDLAWPAECCLPFAYSDDNYEFVHMDIKGLLDHMPGPPKLRGRTKSCPDLSSLSTMSSPRHPSGSLFPVRGYFASEQILTRFSKAPGEIRNMIYAAMVNNPRLLRRDFRCGHSRLVRYGYSRIAIPRSALDIKYKPPKFHATLPPALLLSEESAVEVMKHIGLVHEAQEHGNLGSFPWAYINPEYDVVYPDVPSPTEAPGIKTLALLMYHPWHAYRMRINDPSLRLERECVAKLNKLPNLKEVLLVRPLEFLVKRGYEIGPLKYFGDRYQGTREKAYKQDDEPNTQILEHSCGFFGVINEEVERILAKTPLSSRLGTDSSMLWEKHTQEVVDHMTKVFTEINNHEFPGTSLPKFTGVYDRWVDKKGNWQSVEERMI